MKTISLRSPRRWLIGAALGIAALGGCNSLDAQQRKWIFAPAKQTWWAGPATSAGVAEVWVDFDSKHSGAAGRLHGFWLPGAREDSPALLYLHGARWDVTGSLSRMRRMNELGFAVLGIDYRGFGKSGDELPSEQFVYEDARAAWDYLARVYPARPRYIFGHSLGGAIAVHLATEVSDAAGLVVEGAFTSVADVFGTFRFGWLPVSALITQRFDAAGKIGRVKTPVLVVHGSNDRMIVPELGRALYDKAPEPKRFVLVEGGSHHNTNAVGQPLYREAMRDLFKLPL